MEDAYVLQLSEPRFSEFYLTFCGYADCKPLHSFGPAVRPNYIIHYIVKGKGSYQVGNTRYALGAGECFLIEPDVLTFYQADEEDPWSYLWIGFSGNNAAAYLEEIGLGGGRVVFRSENGAELERIANEMLRQSACSIAADFALEGLLYSFFSVLAKEAALPKQKYRQLENQYARRAVEYIQNYYPEKIRISHVADYVGITRSYLYMIFMKTFGISPQEYLSNYRITRASELLKCTELTVEMVAASCGYEDPLVFSKAFKKRTGSSPSKFRKASRREAEEEKNPSRKEEGELIPREYRD